MAPKDDLHVSRGALWLFGLVVSAAVLFGGFFWNKLSGIGDQVQIIATQQAVLTTRVDNTLQMQADISELRDAVSDMRVTLVELRQLGQ